MIQGYYQNMTAAEKREGRQDKEILITSGWL